MHVVYMVDGPTGPICMELERSTGCRIFSAKTRAVLTKLGWFVTLAQDKEKQEVQLDGDKRSLRLRENGIKCISGARF